jgi:heptaprenyl diphosphate synthase
MNMTGPGTPTRAEKLELTAFFGALCLFFATLEYLFPKPLPFFRLGLANLPVLLALEIFPAPTVLMVILLKVLGQGLVNGTLASYVFVFSVAGSFSSGLVMLLVHRVGGKRISLLGVSVFGAVTSNVVQIFLSVTFIFGQSAWIIAPLFMGLGVASGAFVGWFAQRFADSSRWFGQVRRHYAP